jgi:hypothetical protein
MMEMERQSPRVKAGQRRALRFGIDTMHHLQIPDHGSEGFDREESLLFRGPFVPSLQE